MTKYLSQANTNYKLISSTKQNVNVLVQFVLRNRLCEDISNHVRCGLIDNINFVSPTFIPNEVVFNVDMLGSLVMHGIAN